MTDIQKVVNTIIDSMEPDGSLKMTGTATLALIKFLQTVNEQMESKTAIIKKLVMSPAPAMESWEVIALQKPIDSTSTEELRRAGAE